MIPVGGEILENFDNSEGVDSDLFGRGIYPAFWGMVK